MIRYLKGIIPAKYSHSAGHRLFKAAPFSFKNTVKILNFHEKSTSSEKQHCQFISEHWNRKKLGRLICFGNLSNNGLKLLAFHSEIGLLPEV